MYKATPRARLNARTSEQELVLCVGESSPQESMTLWLLCFSGICPAGRDGEGTALGDAALVSSIW